MLARNVTPIPLVRTNRAALDPRGPLSPVGHILQTTKRGQYLPVRRSTAAAPAVAAAEAAPVDAPAAPAKPAGAKPAVAPKARVQRDVPSLAVSSQATIYGCCGLFDLCGDRDLMSLSFQGADPLLDWIGWERTDVCRIKKNFISWVRPAYSGSTATAGYVADPCADPNGVDWGVCDFTLEDFARLRRQGPVREVTKDGLRLCEAQPRYRLDGTPITNDDEYDMRIITEVIMQDLKRMLISGNATSAGQFDGLNRLVKTGYTRADGKFCRSMDSIVINWNSNTLSGGAGETWNGAAIGTGYNFVDVLIAVLNQIRQRIRWAPALAAQPLQTGDIVLAMPSAYIDCLLNFYTCWRVCPGVAYNENNLNSFDARTFRDRLNGGMFGVGQIVLDGFTVPILPYDYGLLTGPNRFDAFLLTGSVGNVKTLSGQYNDMTRAADLRPDRYTATDGGRTLLYWQDDHTCEKRIVQMEPRLLNWAPFLQARFQNLRCAIPGPVQGQDPTETSFYPETSFLPAVCL